MIWFFYRQLKKTGGDYMREKILLVIFLLCLSIISTNVLNKYFETNLSIIIFVIMLLIGVLSVLFQIEHIVAFISFMISFLALFSLYILGIRDLFFIFLIGIVTISTIFSMINEEREDDSLILPKILFIITMIIIFIIIRI